MNVTDIVERLKSMGNPEAAQGMKKYGIRTTTIYGVSIPNLRELAREIGVSHTLALALWSCPSRETRILASMVDDPTKTEESQLDAWVKDFDNWEVCDQCCMNLFEKTEFAQKKALEWSSREEEFVKRAGFVLMVRLTVRKREDTLLEHFFSSIVRESTDDRVYVKKAVNWALRQIGKKNRYLNKRAIEIAETIQKINSISARWIASDALKELKSEKIQKRLK